MVPPTPLGDVCWVDRTGFLTCTFPTPIRSPKSYTDGFFKKRLILQFSRYVDM